MFLCQQDVAASLVSSFSAENCKVLPVWLGEYLTVHASSMIDLSVAAGD